MQTKIINKKAHLVIAARVDILQQKRKLLVVYNIGTLYFLTLLFCFPLFENIFWLKGFEKKSTASLLEGQVNPLKMNTAGKRPHLELFWSTLSRVLTKYGEILPIFPYSVGMQENPDQNISKHGHFLRSAKRQPISQTPI